LHIKQHVRAARTHGALWDGVDATIIAMEPMRLMTNVRGVMPILHGSMMDSGAEQVVEVRCDQLFRSRVVRAYVGGGVGGHVERMERELDDTIEFGALALIGLVVALEPLQVDAQHVRQLVDRELLRGVLEPAAAGARAPLVGAELLDARERVEALLERTVFRDARALGRGGRGEGQVERDVGEVFHRGRPSAAPRADHVGAHRAVEDSLQVGGATRDKPRALALHGEAALVGGAPQAVVDGGERRDEELVRVLLLVPREAVGAEPHRVEE